MTKMVQDYRQGDYFVVTDPENYLTHRRGVIYTIGKYNSLIKNVLNEEEKS